MFSYSLVIVLIIVRFPDSLTPEVRFMEFLSLGEGHFVILTYISLSNLGISNLRKKKNIKRSQ